MVLNPYEQLKVMNMIVTALMQHAGLNEIMIDIGPMLKRESSRGAIIIPDNNDSGRFQVRLPTPPTESAEEL